jgi:hypothetical protein
LNAAMRHFLIELDVSLFFFFESAETMAKLDVLRQFICDAVQLQSLTIIMDPQTIPLLRPLVETMDACATITRIEVDYNGGRGGQNDNDIVVQLQSFATRNEQLFLFMASPNTYPNDQLLDLMRQFDNCPTGRYRLARSLPEMFTFQGGHSLFPLNRDFHWWEMFADAATIHQRAAQAILD